MRERIRRVVAEKGFDPPVHALDLIEAPLHGLARGACALGEPASKFGNGESIQHES